MYFEFANVLVFSVVAIAFVMLNLAISRLLLRPKSTTEPAKVAIYECGEPTVGQAWVRFDIRFYTVALMFVIFDVEVALLFPWGVIFRDLAANGLGALAFIEAGAFIVILMMGLAYVWVRGGIDWTEPEKSRGGGGQALISPVPHATTPRATREPVAVGADATPPGGASDV